MTVDWTQVSFEHGRTTLKKWRECGVRRSEEVVELWEHVLSRTPSALADEQWAVYEQVCIAALDCARVDLAQTCISVLQAQFPQSSRVLKLKAMQFEATEHYARAMDLYDQLVDADPNNNSYRKRRVAVLMAQGKRLDAIKELNDYLKIFLNDTEGWLQLSELFLQENDVSKAVHCLEECVLVSPLNAMFLRRLADLRYTLGGAENVELARSYYDRALKIKPNDLRSQYGLIVANNWLAGNSKNVNEKKKATTAANGMLDELIERYATISTNPTSSDVQKGLREIREQLGKKSAQS